MPIFDLKTLEKDFKQPTIQHAFEGLYQCLGFITAIASSPDKIKPSEWIKQLIINPEQDPEFDNEQQAKSFSLNLVSWWSHCISLFDHQANFELPTKVGLTKTNKPNKSLQEFAMGYLKGYNWLSATWDVMLPEDMVEANRSVSMLNAILARFVDEKALFNAQPEVAQQLGELEQCFEVLPKLIAAVGMLGKDLSSQDKKQSQQSKQSIKPALVLSEHRQIGRNDPCPCGSGKKFKKCCLH
jgi:uncharacterized protein